MLIPLYLIEFQKSIEKRFWSHVNINDLFSCWEWNGACNENGYGNFSVKYKMYKAHRMAYILTFGNIPNGLFVCHKCDNPSCCNPSHLFLGTNQDNVTDMVKKGRWYHKLTKTEIIQIRESNDTQTNLAKQFKVSITTINKIVNKLIWKHM